MNLSHCEDEVSIGCMIEAGWADAARVPIILKIPDWKPNRCAGRAILETLATYRTTHLEDATHVINSLFSRA